MIDRFIFSYTYERPIVFTGRQHMQKPLSFMHRKKMSVVCPSLSAILSKRHKLWSRNPHCQLREKLHFFLSYLLSYTKIALHTVRTDWPWEAKSQNGRQLQCVSMTSVTQSVTHLSRLSWWHEDATSGSICPSATYTPLVMGQRKLYTRKTNTCRLYTWQQRRVVTHTSKTANKTQNLVV